VQKFFKGNRMAACDDEVSAPGQPLGYLFVRVQRALRSAIEETLRPRGFTMPQLAVMLALGHRSGMSTAELARCAFVTPQAMGEVLAALEAKGCVIRRAHDSHGRILPAELTPAGFEARTLCLKVLNEVEGRMLSGLSIDERGSLSTLLERCLERLDDGSAGLDPRVAGHPISRAER
jgi:DNA-binding MarR family transcriptional regulator